MENDETNHAVPRIANRFFDMNDQDIIDYLQGPVGPKEKDAMQDWILESRENAKRFYQIKAVIIASKLNEAHETVDTEKGLERFEEIAYSKTTYRRLVPYLKYAAAAIVLIGLGILFQQGFFESTDAQLLVPVDEVITLELENGTIKVIDEDGNTQIMDKDGTVVGSQKGTQLVYEGKAATEEVVYNILTVPYGKRFDLLLSDGTVVYLNAGTKMRYPVTFLEGARRQVFLTGEAYFDVAKDPDHPFIVNAEELNVQVVGTEFNVSAYQEDETTAVVLVEGSVGLYQDGSELEGKTSMFLEPGFQGTFGRANNNLSAKKVNTSIYTAWMSGELVFRNIPFDTILLKMERHYNVTITNQNRELGRERFNASFLDQPIENILRYFNETHEIQYHIENNQVIID